MSFEAYSWRRYNEKGNWERMEEDWFTRYKSGPGKDQQRNGNSTGDRLQWSVNESTDFSRKRHKTLVSIDKEMKDRRQVAYKISYFQLITVSIIYIGLHPADEVGNVIQAAAAAAAARV